MPCHWDDPATLFQMPTFAYCPVGSAGRPYRITPAHASTDHSCGFTRPSGGDSNDSTINSCSSDHRAQRKSCAKRASSNAANLRGYQGSYQGSRGAGRLHRLSVLGCCTSCHPLSLLPSMTANLQAATHTLLALTSTSSNLSGLPDSFTSADCHGPAPPAPAVSGPAIATSTPLQRQI